MRKILAASVALFLALLGLSVLAAPAQATTTTTCNTDRTGWTTDVKHGDRWVQTDERTVTDEEAWDEIIVVSEAVPGQHYSYKGGPIEGTPLPPSEDPDSWQANTELEPHYQGNGLPASNPDGTPYVEGQSGLHYTSHQNEGLADWFYYQAPVDEVTEVVHHDAVTHQEYKFEREICKTVHEPKPDNPDEPKPDKPEPTAPVADKPELPHTGAGSTAALALLGSSLIGLGSLLYRKFA